MDDDPWFDNQVGTLELDGRRALARLERAKGDPTARPELPRAALRDEHSSARARALTASSQSLKTCDGCGVHDDASEPSGEATHLVTSRTDAELLTAARQDPEAFREFYDRYAVWMRSWFKRQTGSDAASLDLTAETFAQAWHASRRFRDLADGSGAPWLFGIARNLLRQYHKHNRIESAARERLGLQATYAECDDYERVDDRSEAGALAPLVRRRATGSARRISAARSSCGSCTSSHMTRSPAAWAAPRTPRACASHAPSGR